MKQLSLLFALSFVLFNMSFATDKPKTEIIAKNFFFEQVQSLKQVNYNTINIESYWHEKSADQNIFSVYNFENGGFVIVAESELVTPILGFAFEGHCNQNSINPALRFWLDFYSEQIIYAAENNIVPHEKIVNEWNRLNDVSKLKSSVKSGVLPMLNTKWNQGRYYNAECPEDAAGPDGRVVTGCVATAIGQLINYFRYPVQGTGSYGYMHDTYGWIEEDFSLSFYNYNQMPDNLTDHNYDVAKLLYDIGVSVDMNYGPDGSGMWNHKAAYTLKTYFGYNENTQYLFRDSMPEDFDWRGTLIEHLDQKIPLYYAGWGDYDYISGHAFIVDGYQNEDYFHFNWGWGGSSDGFFHLDNLVPGGSNFKLLHEVVVNAVPDFSYVNACETRHTLNSYSGIIDDGSGPLYNYLPNTDCEWLIQPNDSANGISFKFFNFDLADDDYVVVFDGPNTDSPVIASFYGGEDVYEFESLADEALVKFVSNSENENSGFQLHYEGNKAKYCILNQLLTEVSGIVTDGSGDYEYHNNTNCSWRIEPENAQQITINFLEFDLEEENDYVRILNSSGLPIITYSGSEIPDDLVVNDHKIRVLFKTDSRNRAGGFTFVYNTTEFTSNELKLSNELKIYPNPSSNYLNIQVPANFTHQYLELISSDGRILRNINLNTSSQDNLFTLDISDLNDGTYFIRFINYEQTFLQKLIIKK
ncbi:MAG: T9SS type A sorting domain-containing protein [Bacteroidales bacterium]|nr:T9SS type A sorting domain-containing protein [Bacteroidales bacterium]